MDCAQTESHTIAAIEGQIVLRLAQHTDRDPDELRHELSLADRDLPVDSSELRQVLSLLESDFGVALPLDAALERRLSYVRELAVLIHGRIVGRQAGVAPSG